MDLLTDIENPRQKVYKENAIALGTFLGGPLVAGYLIAENFKAFNQPEKAKKTWAYTIIATVVIFGSIFLIPDHVKMPNQIIPLIYTFIAAYLARHYQGKNIAAHLDSGGQLFSWWRAIAIGIIGLVTIIVLIFCVVFLIEHIALPAA